MKIELTGDEVVALREVLTHRLGDLTVEIRHTNSRGFRAGLPAALLRPDGSAGRKTWRRPRQATGRA